MNLRSKAKRGSPVSPPATRHGVGGDTDAHLNDHSPLRHPEPREGSIETLDRHGAFVPHDGSCARLRMTSSVIFEFLVLFVAIPSSLRK